MPGKNTFANKFSNFWFRVETGIRLDDTQSGFRLYPVRRMKGMRFATRRYEFEVEVLVRAAWRGIEVRNILDDAGEGLFVVVGRDYRQYVVSLDGHGISHTVPLSLSTVFSLFVIVQVSFMLSGAPSPTRRSISSRASACGTTMPRNLHSRMAA